MGYAKSKFPIEKVGVVIVAAGSSRRMEGVDKIFAPILGVPLIAHTVEAFERCPIIDVVVLVVASSSLAKAKSMALDRGWRKVVEICCGGDHRQDSVKLGLDALPDCSWVLIHDGARPCVDQNLLATGLEAARWTGAAVPVVPLTDTVKRLTSRGVVRSGPVRETLWAVQTPQVYRWSLIRDAYRHPERIVTDDSSLLYESGIKVRAYAGSSLNIKVTTLTDMVVAEGVIKALGMEEST
jgi:2-C-methyl-D-erythritol 4-phosphate cytidylyltransferase